MWELSCAGLAEQCGSVNDAGNLAETLVVLLSEEPIDTHTAMRVHQVGVNLSDLLLASSVLLAGLLPHGLLNDPYLPFRLWLQYAVHMDDLSRTDEPTSSLSVTGMDQVMQSMMVHTPSSVQWLQVCGFSHPPPHCQLQSTPRTPTRYHMPKSCITHCDVGAYGSSSDLGDIRGIPTDVTRARRTPG